MLQKRFTHLHLHTEYSLLDGACRIKDLVKRARELEMDSLAITDHGSMYGVVDFYKEAKKQGIKPILGFEAYVAPRKLRDKDPQKDKNQYHLILLAENQEGWQNLLKICSIGFVDGYYYKPRIDHEILREYRDGIIALSGCLAGEVQSYLLENNYQGGLDAALLYKDIFGPDNFFLEMQDHGIEEQKLVNNHLMKVSEETGIKLVATNDVHYINREDAYFHDVLLCIQTQKTVKDEDRMKFDSDEFYLKSHEEMSALFPVEAINNTADIAKRCNVELDFDTVHLPEFELPKGWKKVDYFRKICQEGLEERYKDITKETQERLDYEISIIEEMGYVDYFLIVWDFIKYARDNNIMVGPGRGSAAGSLVAYSMKITDIDPLKYNLIFERFLNPERVSMPDIDVDFCYERREEVIDYVKEKYGRDRVAQIITFGTMAARGSIRDVGRALDMPYGEVDSIAKKIPLNIGMTIKSALEINKELKDLYHKDIKVKELLDLAMKVEGLPRHSSTHAAGVLISKEEVTKYVPLSRNKDVITTQFNMIELEELGLLKMDFLGLRTLTVIRDAIELIEENYQVKIDFSNCNYDDKEVYKLFANAHTLGIFQFESSGMRAFLRELKPTEFENLSAANALYRPGPMGQIPVYIKNKLNPGQVKYLHPKLEPILDVTYGCMVYQEQVMQIARDIGGFTMGGSDLLRRAMSKKNMDVMEKERKNFIYGKEGENGEPPIAGAIKNGVDEKTANEIYDLMAEFANYAFPKSHSVAYAALAYETAWLKTHYPVEFMAALISSIMGSSGTVSLYIQECKRMGIEILPPDINKSVDKFTVENGKIRFGLGAVKNVGTNVIQDIVKVREERGEFLSFIDFCTKVDSKVLNKRQIESLIKCGAFDSLNIRRSQLMAIYEVTIDSITYQKKRNIQGQFSLFDSLKGDKYKDDLPDIPEFNEKALLSMEKEVVGVYLSGHPLSEYEDLIEKISTTNTNEISEIGEDHESELTDGSRVILGGIITKKQNKVTRNNNMMAFITLEDLYGSVEGIVFPKTYNSYSDYLYEDNIILVEGSIDAPGEEDAKVIINKIRETKKEIAIDKGEKKIYIRVKDIGYYKNIKSQLFNIIYQHKGNSNIIIYSEKDKANMKLPKKTQVNANDEDFLIKLKQLVGEKNIRLI